MIKDEIKTAVFTKLVKSYPEKFEEKTKRDDLFNFVLMNDFSDDDIQESIAKNWWSTSFSEFVQEKYHAQAHEEFIKDRENFYNKLNWHKNFNIGDQNLMVSDETHDKYKNQEVSFFHLGLLTHWTLLRDGQYYIKDIEQSINLKNSLNQNSFHVLVNSLNTGPRSDYIDIFTLISTHNIHSLEDKDINGQTPLDLAREHLKNHPRHSKDYSKDMNQIVNEMHHSLCENLEKISLNQKLTTELKSDKSRKVKNKI